MSRRCCARAWTASPERREEALSANELANVLERIGDAASAAALRDQAEACAGFRVDRSVSYQQMVLLLTRHSQGNRLPALGDGHYDCPQDSCVERCHRAFNAFSNETCLTSALHRLVAIAQKELKSERGALFRRDEDNRLACVAAVNLTDELDKRLAAYSGGMKQRLLLAAALLGDPRLLILDEPTAGLDPRERVRLRTLLAGMAQDRIILVATHVVSDVESVATKVILLRAGKIVDAAPVPDLIAAYAPGGGLEDVYLNVFGEGDGK